MRKLLIGSHAALLVLLAAAPAVAQAAPPQYESSEPSQGAAVHEPPDRVEVTFDQPLDGSSSLAITDECDRRVDDGETEVSGNTMSVALEQKPSGEYHVLYVAHGIGRLTGTNEDHFSFTAHAGDSCGKKGDPGHHPPNGGNHPPNNNHPGNHDPGKNGNHGPNHGDDHEDATHSGTDHSTSSGHDDGHTVATGSSHDEHSGPGDGSGDHSGKDHTAAAADDFDGITSSDTSRNLLTRATSTTLLISLFLCAALGILGGAVLRATNAK